MKIEWYQLVAVLLAVAIFGAGIVTITKLIRGTYHRCLQLWANLWDVSAPSANPDGDASSGSQRRLAPTIQIVERAVIIGETRQMPLWVKRVAWAKFVLRFYDKLENRVKPLRLRDFEFRHIVPLSQGGKHSVDNVIVLPRGTPKDASIESADEFDETN